MKSKNNLEKARKLYLQYGQSGFHMMREGILENYKQYNISKEQEDLWTNEFIEQKLQKFNINNQNDYRELLYIIGTKNKYSIIIRLNKKIKNQISENPNPYLLIDLGQKIFHLLIEGVRLGIEISKEIRLDCINTIYIILNKSKEVGSSKKIKISDYLDCSDKLTDEQHYNRMLIDLECDLIKAYILK